MAGIELGGQSREEAAELIAGIEPLSAKLTSARKTFTVRAPQAGLVVDVDESADRAYSSGRSGVGAVLKGPLTFFGERELEVVYGPVNPKRLTRTVNRIAGQIDRKPFLGALAIEPDTLEVAVVEPRAGVVVRRGAGQTLLATFREGRESMEIPVRREAAPSEAEVQAVARDAERYLLEPVQIRTAGGPVTFAPSQLARILTVETDAGSGPGVRLGGDRDKAAALIASLADRRDRPARDAGIDTPAQPPVTLSEPGDVSWQPVPGAATFTRASPGRRILRDRSVRNLIAAIREGEHEARFPTERVEPGVPTSAVREATSLLGTFTTSYACCEPRVTNIQRMARTVDGTVVGPGEQFSLNEVAGERTRANGYKPAPTIGEGNELIDTVGGGVSQFSTTMYNAAYFSGLQIDAHTAHSFYIDRYPAGRESTLNFGTIDLLWTNDTSAPVVVRSSASDTSVTVSLYGDSDARRVRAETQSRSGNSLGAFDITIDRVIVRRDGSRDRDSFTTSYGLPAE